jgi:SAM-dependent methyltransferase
MTSTADARRDSIPIVEHNLANYDSEWSAREYSRTVGLSPIETTLVDRYFRPAPADILDIGCGAGRTSAALHARGYRVVAVDLSESLLSIARSRHSGIDFRLMDASRLALDDGAFDAALFSYNGIDCLYPEASRTECMREVARVLKPGGVFMFSSHNLIGAFFSGGFWYPRGYFNSARFIGQQLTNPLVREWYMRYEDGGGRQHLFSGPPRRTVRQLQDTGFDVVDVCGSDGERNSRQVLLHAQHVNFVARRPPAP